MKSFKFIYVWEIFLSAMLMIHARQEKPFDDGRNFFPLRMPNVHPEKEAILCTAFQMPTTDFKYVVEFTPNASMHTAHHIIILGCDTPGHWERDTPRLVWECANLNGQKSGYLRGPMCKSGLQFIYAWEKNAHSFKLPEGVAFKVGKDSGINFLVLQVHYANAETFIKGGKDNSGIILTMLPSDTNKVTKSAGVFVMVTSGMIKAKKEERFEGACRINEKMKIHPFAFRTHTHALGKVLSGYKIDKTGDWHLIGKHNPQEPQRFYPVEDKNMVIEYGDIVATRCTMYNFRNRTTYAGKTSNDEMCMFYMMYYVDGDTPMEKKTCFSLGPPIYYWRYDAKIDYVPRSVDLSASILDK